jgi:subtilisin family serine protease
MNSRPAYSTPFAADSLEIVAALPPIEDITEEWAYGGSSGEGIKVAVIDSGIEGSHPAVGGVNGYVAVRAGPAGPIFDTEPHDDLFGHGTACAGIIRSLAPRCELYSVQVLGPEGMGETLGFPNGLRWAIENNMHICNVSMGSTAKEAFTMLHVLADAAYFQGTILVCAANNMPIPSYPSVYASVISVAAHEDRDPYCWYVNPHPPVEYGAPGINVRVAWKDGRSMTATGNSFAAPHLAGIVARILGKHPGLVVPQVKVILRALAANVRHKGK